MTDVEFRKTVAKNLAAYRKMSGLTQLELAEKLNYSDKSVSKWERGDGLPDVYVLKTLADFYGVTLNDFVSEKAPRRPKSSRRQHVLIPILSVMAVWLVATIVYMVLSMLPFLVPGSCLVFIFAIPVTMIVLTVFSVLWWHQSLQLVAVSGLVWTIALCVFRTVHIHGVYLIWCVAAVIQVMAVLWFFLMFKKGKKNNHS